MIVIKVTKVTKDPKFGFSNIVQLNDFEKHKFDLIFEASNIMKCQVQSKSFLKKYF